MSTFSGGAPAVVAAVMSYVQAVSEARNTTLMANVNAAIAAAQVPPSTKPYVNLNLPDIQNIDARSIAAHQLSLGDLANIYGSNTADVARTLANGFSGFISSSFPSMGTYVAVAETWLSTALGAGGTGVNATVEDQIWSRERTRVLRDAHRASDEAMTAWVGRGFAMPPGALLAQLATVDRDAQEKIGESSRERAIKTWDIEVENMRLAVNRSLDTRNSAMSAALEYMKNVALAPQLGLEITKNVQTAQQRMNEALLEFYKADLSGLDYNLRLHTFDTQMSRQKEDVDLKAASEAFGQKIAAVMAGAEAQGQQAAAALNGLHAQGTVSGSDTTSTQILG